MVGRLEDVDEEVQWRDENLREDEDQKDEKTKR